MELALYILVHEMTVLLHENANSLYYFLQERMFVSPAMELAFCMLVLLHENANALNSFSKKVLVSPAMELALYINDFQIQLVAVAAETTVCKHRCHWAANDTNFKVPLAQCQLELMWHAC